MKRGTRTALYALAAVIATVAQGACASSATSASQPRGSRNLITAQEIAEVGASTAHEAVQRLRPHWLAPGTRSVGDPVSYQYGIVVYLDRSRLGDIETLRTVAVPQIASIRYLTASEAQTALPDVSTERILAAIVIRTR